LKESLLEEEMARSFNLMKMVMDLKAACPEGFHYVRGNHDDIKETLKGFEKYDSESARVKQWTKDRFGEDFLDKYADFEATLPLIAKGKDFVVSHAAPSKVLETEDMNNRDRQAALSLTWTDNTKGGTNEDIIKQTMRNLGLEDDAKWFIGHRGVGDGKVREQFDGKLVQINHDEKQLIAIVSDGKSFDSGQQVLDLKK
jgi:calcineurin-like phosphoesterase family protein